LPSLHKALSPAQKKEGEARKRKRRGRKEGGRREGEKEKSACSLPCECTARRWLCLVKFEFWINDKYSGKSIFHAMSGIYLY
jgi:hypothetical protein